MRTLYEIQHGPLRLYSFVNYYLSDLQRGLQTAHLVAELFQKYQYSSASAALILSNWAYYNKTIIILNGGNQNNLDNILNQFQNFELGFPFGMFQEDIDSLNGALTCVGVIFPEFSKEELEQFAHVPEYADNFIDLMRLIRSYPLA